MLIDAGGFFDFVPIQDYDVLRELCFVKQGDRYKLVNLQEYRGTATFWRIETIHGGYSPFQTFSTYEKAMTYIKESLYI